jgi:hypothetical protein
MASSVGWTETLDIMKNTYASRRQIYAPNASTFVVEAIDAITKNYTSTDVAAVLSDAQAKVEQAIEDEKFIFGE